jgi:hypothetical protein
MKAEERIMNACIKIVILPNHRFTVDLGNGTLHKGFWFEPLVLEQGNVIVLSPYFCNDFRVFKVERELKEYQVADCSKAN